MTDLPAPLAGVRVLDMGWSWAGPYAGMILADLGADVIKLESGARIDILRWSGAFADELRHHERSGYYGACNRGKRSCALNLKHERASALLCRLVAVCDVLIENFAPRVLPALGMAAERLRAANPRLVMLSMSGYGADGPARDFVSYGDHLLHASGIAALTGEEGDPHTKIGIFYGDPVGGMVGALGVLAALEERERTGMGAHLDLSQVEGLASLIPTALMRAALGEAVPRAANGTAAASPHGFYRCAGEDAWVAVACRGDGEWSALRQTMADAGHVTPAWVTYSERARARGDVDAAVGRWTVTRSPWQVTRACQTIGVPAYPVQNAPRLLWDEHLGARGAFPLVHHPVGGPAPLPGVTFRVGSDGASVRGPAPLLGEHNIAVYRELLGLAVGEYDELVQAGVIA